MFFQEDGDAFRVSQMPLHQEMVPCHAFCLWILHTAALYFNELLTGKPWTVELQQIAEQYGFPTTLPEWQGEGDTRPK